MKTMKKLFALLLAVLMVMGMATTAMADDTTYTAKIYSEHAEHSYTAYQIFAGKLAGSVLSDITWGDGVSAAGQTALQNAYGKTNASGVAGALSKTNAPTFANNVAQYLVNGKSGSYDSGSKQFLISGLKAGYYLIKETGNNLDGTEHAYSEYILEIVNNVEVSPKSGVPTLTKEVKLGGTETYKEAISATVGDTVYFRLTASLHAYAKDYSKYYFRFDDTLPAGLTYKSVALSVQSGTTTYPVSTPYYSVSVIGNVLSVTVQDIHSMINAATGSPTTLSDKIFVEIETTVNENVTISKDGNINKATLYFSNDPNSNYDGTGSPGSLGHTKEAQAAVYSYQINVTKVDAADANTKLENAEFIVGYNNGDNTYTWYVDENKNGVVDGTTSSEENATRFISDENGQLMIKGLKSGTYHIREKAAPAQYNLLTTDIIVIYSGSLSQDTGLIDALTITSASGASHYSTDLDSASINLTVTNTKGATLPTTGGIGTTIFYIVGGVLVLGAGAAFVMKRRNEEA